MCTWSCRTPRFDPPPQKLLRLADCSTTYYEPTGRPDLPPTREGAGRARERGGGARASLPVSWTEVPGRRWRHLCLLGPSTHSRRHSGTPRRGQMSVVAPPSRASSDENQCAAGFGLGADRAGPEWERRRDRTTNGAISADPPGDGARPPRSPAATGNEVDSVPH